MDIVSRLKKFLEYTAIPITQFADTATIPRPTLSQILNGRNKKISNEILDKIHTGFPGLNMMWLMFGDGDMMIGDVPMPIQNVLRADPDNIDGEDTAADSPVEANEEATQGADENTKASGASAQTPVPPFAIATDSKKKIQNIMVFYSDNSFEIFVPSNR